MPKSCHNLRLLRIEVLILAVAALFTPASQAVPSAAREWNERTLAAIRINVPNPPAHARNLFHVAVAMYVAWAAYDTTAVGYIYDEKISPLPGSPSAIEAARHEAISYAAYRVLRSRFSTGAGAATTLANLDEKLTELGYSPAVAQGAVTNLTTPAELGKRIGQAILDWGAADGFSNTTYPQPYDTAVNPNMATSLALSVLGNNGDPVYFPEGRPNMPLGAGIPAGTDPNFWQPLALSSVTTQNGIVIPGGIQSFVGVQSLATTPFSLTRTDPVRPWLDPFGGPSRLSVPGNPSATDAAYREQAMGVLRASSQLNDPTVIDVSPGAIGNNPLGADTGAGYEANPVTGLPYPANLVTRGDFARVLAEYWADGPNSETPPGHWHVLANQVADNPLTVKKIRGTGPVVNDLEWDVKTYFSLAAATHDAACAAWALKRYYSGPRPITMIRYMGIRGQSSDVDEVNGTYNPQGLPLEPGLVEVITEESAGWYQRHEFVWNVFRNAYEDGVYHIGEIAIYSWPGEHPDNLPAPSIATHQSTVRWMLAKDWLPFQRKTFNTPAFPGYVSGHSTFSRAAAEVLTLLTGSPSFPGGFHHHTVPANSMQIDLGPSTDVDLQWNTYYDAADQAGQSRRWGGIHPSEDDYAGRVIGSQVGMSAFALAESYWTGAIAQAPMVSQISRAPGGEVTVKWNATRGMYYTVLTSSNLRTWSTAGAPVRAFDTNGVFIDANPGPTMKYYCVCRSSAP